MPKRSAGLLMYRMRNGLELLLAHPGGPFWRGKDLGAWTIPKGEYADDEDPLTAARREFREELGCASEPVGEFTPLTPLKQPSGKVISAWAFEGDWNPGLLVSNTFNLEWPKGSGVSREYPEIDRAAWFDAAEARRRIIAGQVGFIEELEGRLASVQEHPGGRQGSLF